MDYLKNQARFRNLAVLELTFRKGESGKIDLATGVKIATRQKAIPVGGKTSKRKKLAKVQGWSPMDLPVKWHFSEYKFDMK